MSRRTRFRVLPLVAIATWGIQAFASTTATITVNGSELAGDANVITVAFNGFTETVHYGQFSTSASLASALAGMFSRDYLQAGLCAAVASPGGSLINFKLRGGASFGMLNVTGSTSSFTLTSSGFASQGSNSAYDTGTVALTVGGQLAATTNYGEGATPESVAAGLANSVAGSYVSIAASGSTIYFQTTPSYQGTDYSFSLSTSSNLFPGSPSFTGTPSSGSLQGGAGSSGSQSLLYAYCLGTSNSYCASSGSGYDPAGNVLNYTDSVIGTWSMSSGYDSLNRLTAANPTAGPYHGLEVSWSYDDFGNRLSEILTGSPSGNVPIPGNPSLTFSASNQILTVSGHQAPTYDAAGNITTDTVTGNQYLYDTEGRVCAVQNNLGGRTGYLYDAEGTRIAKGTLLNMSSCDPAVNGFQLTNAYVLGPSGEQLAEAEQGAGGELEWEHTNVWAGGKLLATYQVAAPSIPNLSDPGNPFPNSTVHFYLNDPLGTRRALTDGAGVTEQTCVSLPFGDGESCMPSPTEHLFTGKERDAESGNDYFEARYYASTMGRFMSPDWSAQEEPVPYAKLDNPQTLNLYSYVENNPLTSTDPTGHEGCCDLLPTMDEVDAVAKPLIDSAVTGVEDAAGVTVQGALGVVGFLFTAGVGSTATASHDQLYNEDTGERYVPEPQAASGGAMKGTGRGGQNDDTKAGQDAHRDFSEKAKAKGWQVEPRLTDPKTGQTVKPDAVTGTGKPVELKPNTASGRAKGRSQLKKYERATGKKGRVVYYDKPKQPNQ